LFFVGAALSLLWFATGLRAKEEVDPIRFDHALHAENDVECDVCHEGAASSTSGKDVLLPAMDVCADCHDVEDESACTTCHTNEEYEGYPKRPLAVANFSHKAHIDQGMECGTCHPVEEGSGESAQPALPTMTQCRTCHETASRQTDCANCHGPEETLKPADHGPQFVNLHGISASFNEVSCADCHTQTDCQDCHNGNNVRPRTHPLNYMFNHALDARSKEVECATCHMDYTFCADCHTAQRIMPQNHSQAGWVSFSGGGGQHAIEGKFDMEQCMACHDTSTPVCAGCHGN
jgi:hypothetical protein